jgi:hypothetical protein
MDSNPALTKLYAKLIKRQIPALGHTLMYPLMMVCKLAASARPPLPLCRQRTGLTVQDHQVIHKTRRHAEMS